jgi:hypothetical protein
LTVEVHAHSTITGKPAEYVLTADYAQNAAHTLDPSEVVSVELSEPTHVVAIPGSGYVLGEYRGHFTNRLSFSAANHGVLSKTSYPLYWDIYAEYFIGQPNQLNDRDEYVSGNGNSNYGGAGGGICLDPLPPSVLPLVNAQAQQLLQDAESRSPITLMPNLSSDFLPCKVP